MVLVMVLNSVKEKDYLMENQNEIGWVDLKDRK